MLKQGLLFILVIILFRSTDLSAQRGHEIQFQTGYFRNWGVMYYDYNQTETKRHNYEFDPVYDADLLSLSWHYPINAYIDIGLSFTKSYDASFELIQAESVLFDSEDTIAGPGPQTDGALFAGLTDLESRYMAAGLSIRVNHLIKSNKYKFYFILNPAWQQMKNFVGDVNSFEADNPGLKQALLDDFTGVERSMSLGIGMGVSYPLKSGINLKILEIYNRYIINSNVSNFLSQNHSLEIRTGIAYQFYRKK